MRVVVDASNLRAGGGLTHLVQLLRAVDPRAHGVSSVQVWSGRKTLDRLSPAPWLTLRHDPALDGSLPQRAHWQARRLAEHVARDGDLLFVPGGASSTGARPRVVMCRNMLPFERDERRRYGLSLTHARLLALRAVQARSFARADGVIFLSEYARQAIRPLLGTEAPPSRVIAHGVDDRFRRPPRPPREVTRDRPLRVVMVSQLAPYKHPDTVVAAVRALVAEGLPVRLDLYGPAEVPAMARAVTESLRRYDPAGAVMAWHGPVSFDAIDRVYAEADVFVFASSCENMPNTLVEAMASGLAVVCSDRGPMPEVLGDAGVYFDPEDWRSLYAALRGLVHAATARAELATASYTRALGFTWSRCAAETWRFLREVNDPRGRGF